MRKICTIIFRLNWLPGIFLYFNFTVIGAPLPTHKP